MAPLTAAAERTIAASPETPWAYVSDFVEHHPKFLPPAFSDFKVEAGGVGVGTVTSSMFRVGGRNQSIRTRVSRVVPGRLVEEVVLDQPMTTTFAFTPDGPGATVRIETTWEPQHGVAGLLERLFAPRMIGRVYAEELALLEAYAASRA